MLLLSLLLCFGCSQHHFNVPMENFAEKVKVLGIAPIMVDVDSDIKHPQKDQLVGIISDLNRKYEPQLVRKLKETGNFYTAALLDGDPQRIFSNLLFRREKRDDATIQYHKYFWKNSELREYLQKNNLDAVMLIVVGGLSKTDRIYSSNLLSSMTSDYNYLIMTAQIVDGNGNVLWEYPNFRRRILTYYPLINLQYPDFSEAEANLTAAASIKFKTLEGIQRKLDQKRQDLLLRETQESEVYGAQFDEIISFIKYDPNSDKKPKTTPAEPKAQPADKRPAAQEPAKVPSVQQPATPTAEAVNAPVVEITRVPKLEPSTTEIPAASNEAVK
jgi:hypothetical protein